jgi:pantoate--beta-alanine ligase
LITARTIEEVRSATDAARAGDRTIGFVPTMGFLHEGHLSLIRVARQNDADFIVVSIFVNPLQFGPNEDFERYPRDEKRDRELLEGHGVDLLFLPAVEAMYPPSANTKVVVGEVAEPLEGERRPGHFTGVATVVMKLFNIVQPDVAVFGRKDAQQCAVIDQMVRDLDVPVRLLFGETIREHTGLALSSRNSYLSKEQRALAPILHRALSAGADAIRHGIHDIEAIETLMRKMAGEKPGAQVDYLTVVDPLTFRPPKDFHRDVVVAGALGIGKTRLIDNIRIAKDEIPLIYDDCYPEPRRRRIPRGLRQMIRSLVRTVIHDARVTHVGSVALQIDAYVLRAADILPYEQVEIVNQNTGAHLRTWIEAAAEGSGEVRIHSGAQQGDIITIICYGMLHDGQTLDHKARVIRLDPHNRLLSVT